MSEDPRAPRDDEGLLDFWQAAQAHLGLGRLGVVVGNTVTEVLPPVAWSFGDSPAEADREVEALLAGRKTATSAALSDYSEGDLPREGDVAIVLDGERRARALVRTSEIATVPLSAVTPEQAAAELGASPDEPGVLERWHAERDASYSESENVLVLVETLELVYPTTGATPAED
jgi:uncharacterized protein YhfF